MLYDPKTNPVIKALYDAADIVEQRGLAKGIRQDSEGRVCLHGALAAALDEPMFKPGGKLHEEAGYHVRRYLFKEYGYAPKSLTAFGCALWNNADERTKDEVVAALRGTASMLVVGG